jgi:hypothetical protein
MQMRSRGQRASVLRLPIFWDVNDHTGRFRFYLDRVCDGEPVIGVDGGDNRAQIAWCEDVASAIPGWLPSAEERAIWEGLPPYAPRVREIVQNIACGRGRSVEIVDVPQSELGIRLPDYLANEPLWRESFASPTADNLYSIAGLPITEPERWLARLAQQMQPSPPSELRREEIEFLRARTRC